MWSIRNIHKGDDHCIHWTAIEKEIFFEEDKVYECRTNPAHNGVYILIDNEWSLVPGSQRYVDFCYDITKSGMSSQIRRYFNNHGWELCIAKPKNIVVNGYRLLEEPWATDNNDGVDAVCEKAGKQYRMFWKYDENFHYDINKPTSVG